MNMRLDPIVAEQGPWIWWVVTDYGLRTAWTGEPMKCPVCGGGREAMPTCDECRGTGFVNHVPFADRPWDEIVPHLWLGGHDCQPNGAAGCPDGNVFIHEKDGFDLVVSLHYRFGNSPPMFTEHHTYRLADSDLDPEHHTHLDEMAEVVEKSVRNGRKTLVRCQAGLNRSALIAGLAMLRLGYSADDAIRAMRQKRSPYVLCNESFVAYLKDKEKEN